jgi:isopenicillin-N N-acyltransferase like protein
VRIPVIEASGTHYQVGYQIGVAARSSLAALLQASKVASKGRWGSWLEQSRAFLTPAEKHLPQVVEEVRGCSAGSGVPFCDLFLMSVEELLCEEMHSTPAAGHAVPAAPREAAKGCTDVAASSPATADGKTWLAHNNDLGRSAEELVFVTHFQVTGEPEILAVTVSGLFISIGFNNAGISLTGNQLYANDSRVGVPRQLVVRDILGHSDFEGALQAALLPERASSYNNLIASRAGEVVNVEASATDYELIWASDGVTAHTNHYLAPKMKRFEFDARDLKYSTPRLSRAQNYARKYLGKFSRKVCETLLRDHVFRPWSVCKHGYESVTVFSAIINLTDLKMWLTRGNPCQNEYELYSFDAPAESRLRSEAMPTWKHVPQPTKRGGRGKMPRPAGSFATV